VIIIARKAKKSNGGNVQGVINNQLVSNVTVHSQEFNTFLAATGLDL
jgi:hypothetical protein